MHAEEFHALHVVTHCVRTRVSFMSHAWENCERHIKFYLVDLKGRVYLVILGVDMWISSNRNLIT